MNKPEILIVEDDKAIKNLISTTLEMDILKSKPDKPTAPDPATVPPDDPEEGLPWNEAGR